MDEYLFFQQHKKHLKDCKSVISPKIFSSKTEGENQQNFGFGSSITSCCPKAKFMTSPREHQDVKFASQKVNLKDVEPSPPGINQTISELTAETMQGSLCQLSGTYSEQYAASGFPPKICTLLLKEISEGTNKLKCNVLDIGCGKGYVGEYLKQDGFLHITGLDCSKNLLQMAQSKKAYENVERIAIGETAIGEKHREKYDFVISASMINNDGWDESVFHEMLSMVKMGGFIIFATKLNLNQENQYGPEIEKLSTQMYWKFVTEHTFYRYDKLCQGHGKFSNKKVQVVAYQKTDHDVWLEQEADRLDEEERMRDQKQAAVDEKVRAKEAKLNGAQNERKRRRLVKDKESSMQLEAELQAVEEAKDAELEAVEEAAAAEKRKKEMAARITAKLKEAMWAKLKAAQAEEVARRDALRQDVVKKMEEARREKEKAFNPAG